MRQGKLELRYQPQMDLQTCGITGMEALLRWHDKKFGWVEPCKIIALAEDRGLIEQIFDWVLQTACSQIQLRRISGLSLVPVAVNVSPIQLHQSGFAQIIINVLKEMELGQEPGSLELEIMESAVMHHPELTVGILSQLKGMGVQLSVDDFGTGFSSLSYLARFPIHKLKIAEPIVRDVMTSKDAATIISAIVGMAKKLELREIAEGVEIAAQLAFLKESGCDEIQGYYLSQRKEVYVQCFINNTLACLPGGLRNFAYSPQRRRGAELMCHNILNL